MYINRISHQLLCGNFHGLWGERKFKETAKNPENNHVISYYEIPYYPFADEAVYEIKSAVKMKLEELNESVNCIEKDAKIKECYDCTVAKIKDKLTMTKDDYKLLLKGIMPESLMTLELFTKAFITFEDMKHIIKK